MIAPPIYNTYFFFERSEYSCCILCRRFEIQFVGINGLHTTVCRSCFTDLVDMESRIDVAYGDYADRCSSDHCKDISVHNDKCLDHLLLDSLD